jgi:phosphoribosyl 1,2-cyclic phosphodiesterase
MEIMALASSSKANCIYVQDPAGNLLLDCGLPWKKTRQRLNFHTSDLAAVLITHSHMDHCRGAKEAAASGIELYASQETFDALELAANHRAHAVKPLRQYQIGGWDVLPFEAVHDCMGTLGFLLASKDAKMLYLVDSAYCKYRFSGLTHVLIEANHSRDIVDQNIEAGIVPVEMRRRLIRNHMSIEVCKDFLRANDLKRVELIVLCHLSDNNSDADGFKKEIQGLTGKMVVVA